MAHHDSCLADAELANEVESLPDVLRSSFPDLGIDFLFTVFGENCTVNAQQDVEKGECGVVGTEPLQKPKSDGVDGGQSVRRRTRSSAARITSDTGSKDKDSESVDEDTSASVKKRGTTIKELDKAKRDIEEVMRTAKKLAEDALTPGLLNVKNGEETISLEHETLFCCNYCNKVVLDKYATMHRKQCGTGVPCGGDKGAGDANGSISSSTSDISSSSSSSSDSSSSSSSDSSSTDDSCGDDEYAVRRHDYGRHARTRKQGKNGGNKKGAISSRLKRDSKSIQTKQPPNPKPMQPKLSISVKSDFVDGTPRPLSPLLKAASNAKQERTLGGRKKRKSVSYIPGGDHNQTGISNMAGRPHGVPPPGLNVIPPNAAGSHPSNTLNTQNYNSYSTAAPGMIQAFVDGQLQQRPSGQYSADQQVSLERGALPGQQQLTERQLQVLRNHYRQQQMMRQKYEEYLANQRTLMGDRLNNGQLPVQHVMGVPAHGFERPPVMMQQYGAAGTPGQAIPSYTQFNHGNLPTAQYAQGFMPYGIVPGMRPMNSTVVSPQMGMAPMMMNAQSQMYNTNVPPMGNNMSSGTTWVPVSNGEAFPQPVNRNSDGNFAGNSKAN